MCELASEVINSFDIRRTKYASFICHSDGRVINKWMDKQEAINAVNDTPARMIIDKDVDRLTLCLNDAREMLKDCPGHHQNKVRS